jgi:DNA-binding transcriptional MerR regulator
MKIQEIAEKTGLSIHTLRYYEKERLLPPVARLENGHRQYSQEDLYRVVFITRLRASDMPIRDIRRFMTLAEGDDNTLPERLAIMERHREAILKRIADLNEHNQVIENKIAHYAQLLAQKKLPGGEGC